MGLTNIIINDQGQRTLSVSWTFTRGAGLLSRLPSWHVLGLIVMCIYNVPEEGEELCYLLVLFYCFPF